MRKEVVRETDFTVNDRPSTRRGQFFDILKHRFLEMIKLSLLQAVFNMPLIVSIVIFYVLIRNSQDLNQLMTVFLLQGLLLIPCVSISYIGLTGVYYCLKKIIYADGEYASSSFFVGLKEEWKKGMVIGLIAGFSFAIAVIGFFFCYFYLSNVNSAIVGFGIAILSIQLIVVLIVSYYAIGQVVTYDNVMKNTLKNSLIFSLMRFPINLGLIIIHPGILIALTCIMEITMFVSMGLLVVFVVIGHLMWMLNATFTFDKYINKEQNPEFYHRGLKE